MFIYPSSSIIFSRVFSVESIFCQEKLFPLYNIFTRCSIRWKRKRFSIKNECAAIFFPEVTYKKITVFNKKWVRFPFQVTLISRNFFWRIRFFRDLHFPKKFSSYYLNAIPSNGIFLFFTAHANELLKTFLALEYSTHTRTQPLTHNQPPVYLYNMEDISAFWIIDQLSRWSNFIKRVMSTRGKRIFCVSLSLPWILKTKKVGYEEV